MADDDHNKIKSVKGLHIITGLTTAKRREEKKHRPELHQKKNKPAKEKGTLPEKQTDNDQYEGGIDYCA
jgi:hypothetical protein